MDKQKEANEKGFHERATLNRDISEIRGSINASLYNLLKQDECRVDALNDRIKKLQDQRKLFKKPEILEVPKRKHIPPFELSRIHNDLGVGCDDFLLSDPWDFEYRYAFTSGDVTLDVIADKPTGHMEVLAKNDIEFISGVSAARVGSCLGLPLVQVHMTVSSC
jgi:hypothetical protein